MSPSGIGSVGAGVAVSCLGFPTDSLVRLVLDDVIDHLVVTEFVEVHLHREGVVDTRDDRAGRESTDHS